MPQQPFRCQEYVATLVCPICNRHEEMNRTLCYRDITADMDTTFIFPSITYRCRHCSSQALDLAKIHFRLCSKK